ncbi:MAG TPA: 50S ribosomal protein L25 [Ktedonobacterales bacterium]|nr:50S ribosomal protein L25 [Ktedonobacterales bacterium]
MSDQVTFSVQRRTVTGKAVRRLRREGYIPANIYGHHRESLSIQLNEQEFSRFLKANAATTILRLALADGASETAVVRHVQRRPVSGEIEHVDFLHVEMFEPIRARVPIHFEGEEQVAKETGGISLHLQESVEVEALPTALPDALVLDVGSLHELNATLHVSDLRVPSGVKVVTDTAEPVVKIEPPRVLVEPVETAPEAVPTEENSAAGNAPAV